MSRPSLPVLLALLALASPAVAQVAAPQVTAPQPFDAQIAAAAASTKVTVIHFWAPWCPNCKNELTSGGWSRLIEANPGVNFVFVTTWNAEDGHEALQKYGIGSEPNFQLLLHPSGPRKAGDKVTEVLGLPVSWIPTTWVFRAGKMRYALNYGELHFPMLQQLIEDTSTKW